VVPSARPSETGYSGRHIRGIGVHKGITVASSLVLVHVQPGFGQSRFLQHGEMLGHRQAADGHPPRDLTDRQRSRAQAFEDLSPDWITEAFRELWRMS
jgi:hypothetical protein